MPVVIDLDRRIDSQLYRNLFVLSIFVRDLERDHLSGLDRLRQSGYRVNFRAAESQRLRVRPLGELQRQHSHANKIRAMNALEARGHDGFHPEQARSLRRPVAARSGAVFVTSENDQRNFVCRISHRRVENRCLFAARLMNRHAAFGPRRHQVFDPDIREGPARHHQIIPAPAAVAVEIDRADSSRYEILARG